MKRTHYSRGIYPPSYALGRRPREKHTTACGRICDYTKATGEKSRVTCRECRRKMEGYGL